uniref:Gypsy retrotransposon integrase-like protein 1 n=1 Tax=Latimeria chalumnae TaxID=7897 RepID=H3ACW4_LATCH
LSIKLAKCQFCRKELTFLGHAVTPDSIKPDPNKIQAVTDFPEPENVKQICQFLGLSGYYRKFVRGYAMTADPLIALTRRDAPFVWDEHCSTAFQQLKESLTSTPVLTLPDFRKPFTVHTNASDTGLGAVLMQQEAKGHETVIAYASQILHPTERSYSTTEKECLAVIWAIEHFRPYIEGMPFTVVTDHHALQWLMNQPDPSGRLAWWSLRLQELDFNIVHKSGKHNLAPDALSRSPTQKAEEATTVLPNYVATGSLNPRNQGLVVLDDKNQLRILQLQDPVIEPILTDIDSSPETVECRYPKFCVLDGVLYYREEGAYSQINPVHQYRVYASQSLQGTLLKYYHDHPLSGHLGIAKTLKRLQHRVFWPDMRADVVAYVKSYQICQTTKPSQQRPAGYMIPIEPQYPWEYCGVDFIGPLPRTPRGNQYLLIFLDFFSKWVEIFPVKAATAQTAAAKFIEEIFCQHGAPRYLISDRGSPFVNALFDTSAAILGTEHRLTTAYHPQTNQTERVNRTIKTAIRGYVGDQHINWDLHVPQIAFALRTVPHSSTGETPAFLIYGRDLPAPLDLVLHPSLYSSPQDSMSNYKEKLVTSFQTAHAHARK